MVYYTKQVNEWQKTASLYCKVNYPTTLYNNFSDSIQETFEFYFSEYKFTPTILSGVSQPRWWKVKRHQERQDLSNKLYGNGYSQKAEGNGSLSYEGWKNASYQKQIFSHWPGEGIWTHSSNILDMLQKLFTETKKIIRQLKVISVCKFNLLWSQWCLSN